MDQMLQTTTIDQFFKDLITPQFWSKALTVAVTAVLILLFFHFLQVIVGRGVKKICGEQKAQLILKAIRYTGWVIAVVSVLQSIGVNLSALLGAAGIAGIAIGFAAQTSISNLISGIFSSSRSLSRSAM